MELTEHQRQAVTNFHNAISRMQQTDMTMYDIVFWFQNLMASELAQAGLKLFVGSDSNKEVVGGEA